MNNMGSGRRVPRSAGLSGAFGQPWCGFELPQQLAERPIESADPETRRIATKYLEAHYFPSTATLSERVADLARRLLPTGHCSVEAISDQLAMHPRTLQRGLATEGIRCQDLIERERRNSAAKYLAEPQLHLAQITALVGLCRAEHLQPLVPTVVRKDPRQYRAELITPPVPIH